MDHVISRLEYIEGAAVRFLDMAHTFDLVTAIKPRLRFWVLLQNSLGESAVLLWCHLFGSDKDSLHYSQLFRASKTPDLALRMTQDASRERILAGSGLSAAEFVDLRNEVKRCRDKYVAHRELDQVVVFPRIDICISVVEQLRLILAEVVTELAGLDPESVRLDGLVRYFHSNSNAFVQRRANNQFKFAMSYRASDHQQLTPASVRTP